MKRFRSSLWIKDDFNVAIDALVEFLNGLNIQCPVTSPDNGFHVVSLLSSNLMAQAFCGFPPGPCGDRRP
jgi:hypothetical protein